jgi:hypothetical protein
LVQNYKVASVGKQDLFLKEFSETGQNCVEKRIL